MDRGAAELSYPMYLYKLYIEQKRAAMRQPLKESSGTCSLQIDLNRIAGWVALASAAILLVSYLRLFVVQTYGVDTPIKNFRYFDLDEELTIPAWYSSIVLVACGMLVLAISRLAKQSGSRDVLRWTLLGVAFVGMGLDEAVGLHERLIDPLREAFQLSGIFHFAWVVPALFIVLGVAAYMTPLLFRLPFRTAGLFLLAGGLYVGGALGMEMVGGAVASAQGTQTLLYQLIVTVEESLEIAGFTVFFVGLVDHIGRTWPLWTLAVRAGAEQDLHLRAPQGRTVET